MLFLCVYIYIYTYIIYISIYTTCNWLVHIVQLISQPLGQSTENVCLFCLLEKILVRIYVRLSKNMQTRVFLNSQQLSVLNNYWIHSQYLLVLSSTTLGVRKKIVLCISRMVQLDAVFPTFFQVSNFLWTLFWNAKMVVVELRSKVDLEGLDVVFTTKVTYGLPHELPHDWAHMFVFTWVF